MSPKQDFSQYRNVRFRPGHLEDAIQERSMLPPDADGKALDALYSITARRDLERYYAALHRTLRQVRLTEAQAMAVVDALDSVLLIDAATPFHLAQEVADAVRLDGLAERHGIDGDDLIRLLRDDLAPFEVLAIADAVERVKLLSSGPAPVPLAAALRSVGLVRE